MAEERIQSVNKDDYDNHPMQCGPGYICPKCHDDHPEGGECNFNVSVTSYQAKLLWMMCNNQQMAAVQWMAKAESGLMFNHALEKNSEHVVEWLKDSKKEYFALDKFKKELDRVMAK